MPCVCYQNMRDSIHAFIANVRNRIGAFFHNVREWISARFDVYEKIQAMIVIHIYIQTGCSLIGSLSALYNGVTWINLAISLFALIAIASDIESLILTYAVLLSCSIVIDISWSIFFSHTIWNMSSEGHGMLFLVSLRLTLATEIVGLVVRFFTCLLLIQLYRLGLVSSVDSVVVHMVECQVCCNPKLLELNYLIFRVNLVLPLEMNPLLVLKILRYSQYDVENATEVPQTPLIQANFYEFNLVLLLLVSRLLNSFRHNPRWEWNL